jgi:hypothetical protein
MGLREARGTGRESSGQRTGRECKVGRDGTGREFICARSGCRRDGRLPAVNSVMRPDVSRKKFALGMNHSAPANRSLPAKTNSISRGVHDSR